LKADGTLAGVVGFEFVLMGLHGKRAGVEGAVARPSAKGHEHPSAKTKGWDLVADALFGPWCRGLDGPSKLLKRRPLLVAQAGKVLVDGLWFS